MRRELLLIVFLFYWPQHLESAVKVDWPGQWHVDFKSPRNCRLTTMFPLATRNMAPESLPTGTPGTFSFSFYSAVENSGDFWWERLGYPTGSRLGILDIELKKESLNTRLDQFLPLRVSFNGVEINNIHEAFPHVLSIGSTQADDLIARLRHSDTLAIQIDTNIGKSYGYTVKNMDFRIAIAMFEACAKEVGHAG